VHTPSLLSIRSLAATAIGATGALGLGLFGITNLMPVVPASAAPTPVCSAGTCTVTFVTPGGGQSWVVPAGVTTESFTLTGAIGGSNSDVAGGDGARVTGSLTLAAGTTVTVDVGGAGGPSGDSGINGGGVGGPSILGGNGGGGGGGGGGGSDIKVGGTDQLVAGGGGGAGETESGMCQSPEFAPGGAGGNADAPGGDGQAVIVGQATLGGGGGGSAGAPSGNSAAGTAGTATLVDAECDQNVPTATGVVGANGTTDQGGGGVAGAGGGGGGGFSGGGQGSQAANDQTDEGGGEGGGGGGSSFAGPATGFTVSDTANPSDGSFNGGDGTVTISYAVAATGPTAPVTTPSTPGSPVAPATGTAAVSSPLAFTGLNVLPLLIGGVSLIAAGFLLLVGLSLRRRAGGRQA
jgi:hypothetical protein